MVGSYRPTAILGSKTLAACALFLAAEMIPQAATASSIHHATKAEIQASHSWSTYLLSGPTEWSAAHAPTFTAQVRSTIWKDLQATNSSALPMVQYLEWRRGLDPQRFDFYHPKISATLKKLMSQPITTTTAPQTLVPSTPSPAVFPNDSSVTPTVIPSVPEPSAIWLAVLILAWGVCSRRRLQLFARSRTN